VRLIGAASAGGLVALDGEGRVVPSIADRWTVTDDGESYIFRLRTTTWPDGARLDGASAAAALRQALAAQRDTALGLDLSVVESVQAMAARVVEVRLARPVPDFLQLLAQPELGLRRRGQGPGRCACARKGAGLAFHPAPDRAAEDSAEALNRPWPFPNAMRAPPLPISWRAAPMWCWGAALPIFRWLRPGWAARPRCAAKRPRACSACWRWAAIRCWPARRYAPRWRW
jgi:hypothetical protein